MAAILAPVELLGHFEAVIGVRLQQRHQDEADRPAFASGAGADLAPEVFVKVAQQVVLHCPSESHTETATGNALTSASPATAADDQERVR